MPYITIPLISLAVVFLGLVGVYNFVPLSAFEPLSFSEPTLGTSITTINGSDTLSSSRTVINNNFTALNDGKIENSSTSIAAITTLLNLSSVGTITTGTWNATNISVSKWGTGTSSPSQYLVILGNGSAGLTHASSTGTSGQFLTSNGPGAYPSWQTSAVNQNDDYNWLGTSRFKFFHASSTLTINGVALNFPSVGPTASSSLLASDASNNLYWVSTSSIISFDSIIDTATHNNSGTGSTTYTYKIPAGWFKASNVLDIKVLAGGTGSNADKIYDVLFGNGSATTSLAYMDALRMDTSRQYRAEISISSNGTTNSQTIGALVYQSYSAPTDVAVKNLVDTSYNATGDLYISVVIKAPTDTSYIKLVQILKY